MTIIHLFYTCRFSAETTWSLPDTHRAASLITYFPLFLLMRSAEIWKAIQRFVIEPLPATGRLILFLGLVYLLEAGLESSSIHSTWPEWVFQAVMWSSIVSYSMAIFTFSDHLNHLVSMFSIVGLLTVMSVFIVLFYFQFTLWNHPTVKRIVYSCLFGGFFLSPFVFTDAYQRHGLFGVWKPVVSELTGTAQTGTWFVWCLVLLHFVRMLIEGKGWIRPISTGKNTLWNIGLICLHLVFTIWTSYRLFVRP